MGYVRKKGNPFHSAISCPSGIVPGQMLDPLAAAHAQEDRETLENLVRLNAEYDQRHRKLPDKGSHE